MLQVSEIFGPTFQGEGKSAGRTCAFLRLANCNLHCVWCDTDYTWRFDNKHPHVNNIVYRREEEVHKMTDSDVFKRLNRIRMDAVVQDKPCCDMIVISGGEPFMQQKHLIPLLKMVRSWWVEVETNGTLVPTNDFMALVDQVNCSPKLANALDPVKLRRKPEALKMLSASDKVNFKFIIQNEADLAEVLELVETYKFREVRLMPECRTKEELLEKEEWLQEICLRYGFLYCTRLSILRSGTERGV